ncbi:unnamed protein product [Hymenolepis diminuta]|uniref:Charged multivesicular body protein 4b n=1 Tax=Hymenolepis diminuta TaxID=6216 RepID=A0A564ZA44_HYMDI|nr:unnamed protein product [Hymenolepis diminuta]
MSYLKRVFGSSQSKKDAAQENAMKALADSKEIYTKRQAYLEKKIELEIDKAKKYAREKNKRAALECLRRKQLWTKQLESIDGILMNLDAQSNAFENARLNMFYLDATKKCTNTMEILNKSMYVLFISLVTFHRNIDMVHDLVDKTAEQQDITNEITAAISTPTDFDQFDMAELEKEFEMLAEDVTEKLTDVGGIEDLPSVPVGELIASKPKAKSSKKAEEDSELANLQMWSA